MDPLRKLLQSNKNLYELTLIIYARLRKVRVEFQNCIYLKKQNKVIKLKLSHVNHVRGVTDYFDFFHGAVRAELIDGQFVVDFSTMKKHKVDDFILKSVYMPSIAEPIKTAELYAKHLQLEDGMTVIDLGSYAGITGIYFNELVRKKGGSTICVEPDPENFQALSKNLEQYFNITGSRIESINAAVYHKDGVVEFVSEGSMDSAILGNASNLMVREDHLREVKTITLSTLASVLNLKSVDCIKADIEGSELDAFKDALFFSKYHPKIIIEPISLHGSRGARAIEKLLRNYGYSRQDFPQEGARVPLILFN
jgi:FkbM family methyltransferase